MQLISLIAEITFLRASGAKRLPFNVAHDVQVLYKIRQVGQTVLPPPSPISQSYVGIFFRLRAYSRPFPHILRVFVVPLCTPRAFLYANFQRKTFQQLSCDQGYGALRARFPFRFIITVFFMCGPWDKRDFALFYQVRCFPSFRFIRENLCVFWLEAEL